jgi:hypothetical protein
MEIDGQPMANGSADSVGWFAQCPVPPTFFTRPCRRASPLVILADLVKVTIDET